MKKHASGKNLPAALGAFLVPFLLSVALHWILLGYAYPFGGQQSDDDYHYYSFAARFDAERPFDLPAYRVEVTPDSVVDVLDEARIKVSFSNFLPYPAWAMGLHWVNTKFKLSFPAAAFVLFILQTALLIYGIQTLAAQLALPGSEIWWRLGAGFLSVGFLGVEGIPSPLLSIPMNMVTALCFAAFGLLVSGRRYIATSLLLLAVMMHVAAVVVVAFVLAAFTLYEVLNAPRTARAGVVGHGAVSAGILLCVWGVLYYGILGFGNAGLDGAGAIRFTLGTDRLMYLFHGVHSFFPTVGAVGAAACMLAASLQQTEWKLPAASLTVLTGAAAGFVLLGTKYTGFPALHPIGRLLYFAPQLMVFIAVAVGVSVIQMAGVRSRIGVAALVCVVTALGAGTWQSYLVLKSQIMPRQQWSLGPLHSRLALFASEENLPRTSFIFVNHNFGTVLSAAHLYHGRYFWAKVYSPERLEAATASSDRLVYLEGVDDRKIRVNGFCVMSEENVSLSTRSDKYEHSTVRVVQARRC
ncbi:MAG: hypothetical protein O7C67_02330 [Gammaproteobacteria bacterium]|nr:hypothetical protein [Gammaproteobacteria bacterium]MCZ6760077.1 hypothetical protein [Gemmatimonadota bacterium]